MIRYEGTNQHGARVVVMQRPGARVIVTVEGHRRAPAFAPTDAAVEFAERMRMVREAKGQEGAHTEERAI